jgi:hypothetical protein
MLKPVFCDNPCSVPICSKRKTSCAVVWILINSRKTRQVKAYVDFIRMPVITNLAISPFIGVKNGEYLQVYAAIKLLRRGPMVI